MSLKCANPDCGAPFEIRSGRLFHIRHPRGKGAHSLEHFWLCESCSQSYSVHRRDEGIVLHHISTSSEAAHA
jgi:hypothetical protein